MSKKISSTFTGGATIPAHLLRCERLAVCQYSFTFRRLASAPDLSRE
jgi:hypothetical protein